VLCGVGLTSGIIGILLALAQQDLKRLLAYSSVENVGIIALGLGVGLIGLANGMPTVSVIGFAGAFLHVLNHSLFKGMLFLSAGSVIHGSHIQDIDQLGGLLRRMPRTGAVFFIGAAAISGLPPLNGFISEFLIYLASFKGAMSFEGASGAAMLVAIAGLALIGGLAVACFTKAFGIVFLGQPRSENAAHAREVGLAMVLPGFVLAAACTLIGLLGAKVVYSMTTLISEVTGLPTMIVRTSLATAAHSVSSVSITGGVFVGIALLLALMRTMALARRPVTDSVTWDCGYAQPSVRMQYTGSSFSQPLTDTFDLLVRTRRITVAPHDLFSKEASLITHTPDPYQEYIFQPVFRAIGHGLSLLRPLQQGQAQLYILYIAVTLLVLLLWQLA
jgi:NADH:ubiquinone oxidoreductase subunit 5 (subunit L)/multisubunit Na+/H+ antiporter MnhA subunit